MKPTKNMLVIAVGVFLCILMGVAAFLLCKGISQFSATGNQFKGMVVSLRRYYNMDPFPSAENISKEQENVEELERWFDELMRLLRKGQVGPGEKSASKFMSLLSDTKNNLVALGKLRGTALPEDFAFGFDRYSASGVLPAPPDVPRLTQQLIIIEKLCRVFFDEKATEITAIKRDQFDDAMAPGSLGTEERGAGRRPVRYRRRPQEVRTAAIKKAGLIGKGDLFGKLHFAFEFTGKEYSILNVLNRLAAHEMFVVVTSLAFEKRVPDVVTDDVGDDKGRTHSEKADIAEQQNGSSRRERMMCGRELEEPMNVKLELDVYRFKEAPSNNNDS